MNTREKRVGAEAGPLGLPAKPAGTRGEGNRDKYGVNELSWELKINRRWLPARTHRHRTPGPPLRAAASPHPPSTS